MSSFVENEFIDDQPCPINEVPIESRNSEDMDISPVESGTCFSFKSS